MRTMAALLVLAVACAGEAGAQDLRRVSDHLAILNHISCYPFGLDRIGRGETAAGIEEWRNCFAADFKFSVFLGFGQPTECPGDKCELPGVNSIEKRAA